MACHLSGYFFHIFLSFDVNSGDTRQIDNGKIWAVIWKDFQFDGVIDYLAPFTSDVVC